jgi:hypothetical protein
MLLKKDILIFQFDFEFTSYMDVEVVIVFKKLTATV